MKTPKIYAKTFPDLPFTTFTAFRSLCGVPYGTQSQYSRCAKAFVQNGFKPLSTAELSVLFPPETRLGEVKSFIFASEIHRILSPECLKIRNQHGWSIAHELARYGILPAEHVPEEILLLETRNGWTVLHELAKSHFVSDRLIDKYALLSDGFGEPLIHTLAKRGQLPKRYFTFEWLTVKNKFTGESTALALASNNFFPEEFILLPEGDSVPDGRKTAESYLFLADNDGTAVAHELARRGKLPLKLILPDAAGRFPDLLKLANNRGMSVAHYLAQNRYLPEECVISPQGEIIDEILLLSDKNGRTVAYELAVNGILPEKFYRSPDGKINDKRISLANNSGETIAHQLAFNGILPDDCRNRRDILSLLSSGSERTVASVLADYIFYTGRWELLTPELAGMKRASDKHSILSVTVQKLAELPSFDRKEALRRIPVPVLKLLLSRIRKLPFRETVVSVLEEIRKSEEFHVFEDVDCLGDFPDPDLYEMEREI